MYLDGLLQLSNAQAITGTAASTNTLDMLTQRDMGVGEPDITLIAMVGAAFAGGTSLVVQVQGSPDNATWSTFAESRAYTTAELTAGAKLLPIDMPVRSGGDAIPRYYRLNYVVVGTMTAGTISAYFSLDRSDRVTYPPGYSVYN